MAATFAGFHNQRALFNSDIDAGLIAEWETFGGKLVDSVQDADLVFVTDDFDYTHSDHSLLYFRSKYIEDCIQQQKLLPLGQYILTDFKPENLDDDDDEPEEDNFGHVPVNDRFGKKLPHRKRKFSSEAEQPENTAGQRQRAGEIFEPLQNQHHWVPAILFEFAEFAAPTHHVQPRRE